MVLIKKDGRQTHNFVRAKIIEDYVCNPDNGLKYLSRKYMLAERTVSYILSLYMAKPKRTLTLKSNV